MNQFNHFFKTGNRRTDRTDDFSADKPHFKPLIRFKNQYNRQGLSRKARRLCCSRLLFFYPKFSKTPEVGKLFKYGTRSYCLKKSIRTQPERHRTDARARKADRLHRRIRIRKIVARLRYYLCLVLS